MPAAEHSVYDSFDRRNGNGSRNQCDDMVDEKSIFHNEWGSTAATTFDPSEADNSGRFETLYELHNGKGESSRRGSIRRSHIVNDAKTFMSVLEFDQLQRDRVLNILDEIDIEAGSHPYEKFILAICSLISDEEMTKRLRERDDPSLGGRLFLTDEFRDLMEATDMTDRQHRHLRRTVRKQSTYFDDT